MTKLRIVPNDAELDDLLGPEPVANVPMTMDDLRARPPLKPWTFAEYERIPATPWLIGDDARPVLIARGLWVTFGLYKSGKTYLSIEQAFCIAAGVPFNGLPTMQGRVAYVCAEGDAKRIIARVIALCNKHGKEPTEILAPGALNLIMSPVNLIQLDGAIGTDTLIRQLDDGLGDYQAIWFDTWAKMLAAFGGHDTDADSVMPAIAGCDRIRKALGCSVVIVAHVGLSEKAQDRPKGLSDLPGAVDGGTKCAKDGEGSGALFTFSAAMQRYAADEYEFTARMSGTGPENTALRYLTKQQAVNAALDPDQVRMVDILRGLVGNTGDGIAVDEWRDAVIAADLWKATQGKNKGMPVKNPRDKWNVELGKLSSKGVVNITGSMVEIADDL